MKFQSIPPKDDVDATQLFYYAAFIRKIWLQNELRYITLKVISLFSSIKNDLFDSG